MAGEFIEIHDHSLINKKIQHTTNDTYFNELFGRSDLKSIVDRRMLGETVAYFTNMRQRRVKRLCILKACHSILFLTLWAKL